MIVTSDILCQPIYSYCPIAQQVKHVKGIRKVTEYSNLVSSQCSLTNQIEWIHDKLHMKYYYCLKSHV